MRKIWTSGSHIHQETNGEAQRIRIAIEHLSSGIPNIDGPHDIWVHSSDYEKLQEQNKILREALEFYSDKENWKTLIEDEYSHCLVVKSDVENKSETLLCGGKRAREALAKVNNENQ